MTERLLLHFTLGLGLLCCCYFRIIIIINRVKISMLLCYFNNIKNLTVIFMLLKRRQQDCRGVVYATLTPPNQALMELQLQLSQKWNPQSVSKESANEHSLGHLPSRPLPPSKGKWPGKNLAPVPFCLSFCTAPQSSLNVDWFMNGWIKSIRPLKCTLLNLVFHSVMLTTVSQDHAWDVVHAQSILVESVNPAFKELIIVFTSKNLLSLCLFTLDGKKHKDLKKNLIPFKHCLVKWTSIVTEFIIFWVIMLRSWIGGRWGKSDGWPGYLLSLVFALEFQVSESWVQGPVERKFMDKVCGCYQLSHPTGSCSCCCLVAQSCLTLCNPMDCSTPGFFSLHHLPKLAQTHVHWVSDAIQPSHPLSSPSPAFNLSQHQGLFQWVNSSYQVAKVLEFQLQHQSFQWIFRVYFLLDWLIWSPYSPRDSQKSSSTPQFTF